MSKKTILIKPGSMVCKAEKNIKQLNKSLSLIQNEVSLSAVKVTPSHNIQSIPPHKRNCYFDNEYSLKAHQNYSQVKSYICYI